MRLENLTRKFSLLSGFWFIIIWIVGGCGSIWLIWLELCWNFTEVQELKFQWYQLTYFQHHDSLCFDLFSLIHTSNSITNANRKVGIYSNSQSLHYISSIGNFSYLNWILGSLQPNTSTAGQLNSSFSLIYNGKKLQIPFVELFMILLHALCAHSGWPNKSLRVMHRHSSRHKQERVSHLHRKIRKTRVVISRISHLNSVALTLQQPATNRKFFHRIAIKSSKTWPTQPGALYSTFN